MTTDRSRALWAWIVVGFVWLLLCRNLAVHWSSNTQYTYGWLVPVLGLYTALGRWKTRPEPGESIRAGRWLAALAATAFFPTWLVAQPNPDWRLVNWTLTAETVAITLAVVACAGGRRWMWHFAFPICFIFTAVPWPRPWEIPMIDHLMRGVAALTVEVLNFSGIIALRHGNVIEVKTGLLGVDEACSGVRSLQASLMASIFLGELFRFNVSRRFFLVVVGLSIALATNVGRTFFLAWKTANAGPAAMERWHDPAGFTILTICFAGVWLVAFFIGRNTEPPPVTNSATRANPLPGSFLAGLSVWFAFVVIATEAWYYDGGKQPQAEWRLIPKSHSKPVAISAAAAEELKSDQTTAATWREPDGSNWMLFFFEWRPGPMRSRVLAQLHRPDQCLSATGLNLLDDRGTVEVHADGLALRFRAYTFEQEGHPIFVYHGMWQNRSPRAEQRGRLADSIHLASLQGVLWRERNLGEQVAEIAVSGYTSAAEADAAFQRIVAGLIVRTAP